MEVAPLGEYRCSAGGSVFDSLRGMRFFPVGRSLFSRWRIVQTNVGWLSAITQRYAEVRCTMYFVGVDDNDYNRGTISGYSRLSSSFTGRSEWGVLFIGGKSTKDNEQ